MEKRTPPPARPKRTYTPLVFTSEHAWRQACDAMDTINDALEPLMSESQQRHPLNSELRTPELRGKPAFSDYMGARRGGYRLLLEVPKMGGEYTVEHLASIRDNLAKTPDYIARIQLGLAEDADFAPQRLQIAAGLETLRDLTAQMQGMAQQAIDAFAVSPAGASAAGKAIVERYASPPETEVTK